jgi:hypothetical protein
LGVASPETSHHFHQQNLPDLCSGIEFRNLNSAHRIHIMPGIMPTTGATQLAQRLIF